MKYVFAALIAVVALMFLAAPATADWNPGEYAKWFQLPNPNGWDVNFTSPQVLADDFPCFQTGLITDVHLWFSVQGDSLQDATGTTIEPQDAIEKIHLSIHKNIDPDAGIPWSRPAPEPWQMDFDQFTVVRWPQTGQQGWIWPYPENPEWIPPPDHVRIYQANISIDPAIAFKQEGTSANPAVYWLDASIVLKPGVIGQVGWKTSLEQWKDDAVFWSDFGPVGAGWYPLVDPMVTGAPRSLDLAFVITPEPGTVVMLLGAGLIGLLGYARNRRKR